MFPATDKQKRAITWLNRRHPDTVGPLVAERGGSVANLSKSQASEILTITYEKHPKDGGERKDGQRQEEQKQEERQEEQLQNDEQNGEQNDDDDDDDEKHRERMRRSGFRPGSKQEYIANALREHGMDLERTREALKDKIGKIPALTFKANIDGGRQPLPLGTPEDDTQQETQHGRAIKTMFAVRRALLSGGEEGGKQKQKEHKQEERKDNEKNEDRSKREAIEYLTWVRTVRRYCQDKAADGHPLDEIGLRPVEYGAALLNSGIPLTAIKHAVTMHYPPEARRALGVRDYDVQSFHMEDRKDGIHAALPYCLAVVNSLDSDRRRVPLALVGPKGTGKTTLAKQIAEQLTVAFGMVSMTSGTSPSAFNGRPRIADDGTMAMIMALCAMVDATDDSKEAKKYAEQAHDLAKAAAEKGDTVMSQFVKIYGGGGVFLFDEMDAADENLLLGVNAALANGVFANPATGELIEQHPDFIPVAGMNTLGLGSGRDYNARNRLDAATLDRWNAGRVQIALDPRIEESMFWSIINREA